MINRSILFFKKAKEQINKRCKRFSHKYCIKYLINLSNRLLIASYCIIEPPTARPPTYSNDYPPHCLFFVQLPSGSS